MSEVMDVHKVTLSTKKVVFFRDMKIKDQEMAATIAGSKADSKNELSLGLVMQKELLKILLVKIGEKTLQGPEKEDLDGLFTYREYIEAQQAVNKISGADLDMGNFQMELVSSGNT